MLAYLLIIDNYDLLQHADRAQQAFSSDTSPSLHLALPALEALRKAWSTRRDKIKYSDFTHPLTQAINKITEYYEKSAESDAFILAMGKFVIISVKTLLVRYLHCVIYSSRS
jgi:hypothetical protein